MPSWVAFSLPYAALCALVWLTYWPVLFYGWVSDDCTNPEGKVKPISHYDGTLQRPISWGTVIKWLRWASGRRPNPNKNWKAQKQLPYVNLPRAHHRLNVWLFCGVAGVAYSWLLHVLPQPVAFLTVVLFVVHPLGSQTVAWVSGINYILGAFFMLLGLNLVMLLPSLAWYHTPLGTLTSLLGFGLCQWMAGESMFQMTGVTLLLLWFHAWPFALIAGLMATYQACNTFRESITLRRDIFHEQQMGQSTKFYARKLIVVLKTLYYDVKLALWPRHLGLYHPFCYHYELPQVEYEDRYAMAGIGLLLLLGLGLWKGSFPAQLGCLWFLAFISIFLNWVTANQFVVDRYVWLPSFGVCLLAASFLPAWLFWIVTGIALARTWMHLPTYLDELQFYLSNLWNFPTSEVAEGNLGVAYMSQGYIGACFDAWCRGIQLNPDYDVCWYNLGSMFLSRGPLNPTYFPRFFNGLPREVMDRAFQKDPARSHLHLAQFCLEKAIAARSCHFPQRWQAELQQLDQQLAQPVGMEYRPAPLIQPLMTAALT